MIARGHKRELRQHMRMQASLPCSRKLSNVSFEKKRADRTIRFVRRVTGNDYVPCWSNSEPSALWIVWLTLAARSTNELIAKLS